MRFDVGRCLRCAMAASSVTDLGVFSAFGPEALTKIVSLGLLVFRYALAARTRAVAWRRCGSLDDAYSLTSLESNKPTSLRVAHFAQFKAGRADAGTTHPFAENDRVMRSQQLITLGPSSFPAPASPPSNSRFSASSCPARSARPRKRDQQDNQRRFLAQLEAFSVARPFFARHGNDQALPHLGRDAVKFGPPDDLCQKCAGGTLTQRQNRGTADECHSFGKNRTA